MPSLQPRQFRVGRARTGFGHLGQTEVDSIGKNRGQQQGFVFGLFVRLQMCEVTGESGPLIDFLNQLCDLDMRQQH